ncbi:ovoinhibitor-like [Vanessa atalanta]|uniref:ovoinhibitor-like n=1 Tax=Vanessa atalanta TaxID=42275 RepID=UPI001FCD69B6|nr:ovoinhibitor-like [Vanessa atalanta]
MKEYLFCVFISLGLGNQKVFCRESFLTKSNVATGLDKNQYNPETSYVEGSWDPILRNRRHSVDEEQNYEDKLFFPDDDYDDAPHNNLPNPQNIETCMNSCQYVDTNYDPVCGTDYVTYINLNQLECAMNCGVDVRIRKLSACPGWSETTTTPTTVNQNEMLKSCMLLCPSTQEYNPVCGTNNITYYNYGKLFCAQVCGVDVQLNRRSPCPKRPKSTTDSFVATRSLIPYELTKEFLLCLQICPTTPEYDPVCGSNQKTYYNIAKLQCARNCGIDVTILKRSHCSAEISTSLNKDDEKDLKKTMSHETDQDFTVPQDVLDRIFSTNEGDGDIIFIRS